MPADRFEITSLGVLERRQQEQSADVELADLASDWNVLLWFAAVP